MPRRWMTEREAKQFVSAEQIKKARLTPKAVSLLPRTATHGPEEVLAHWLQDKWPIDLHREYCFSVRHKYRFDFAWPGILLAVEVDGWEFHGKHLKGWERDRKKDRVATMDGWRVLRFTAREILQEMPDVIRCIGAVRVVCGGAL